MNDKIEDFKPYFLPDVIAGIVSELEKLLALKLTENEKLPKGTIYVSPGKTKKQYYLSDCYSINHRVYMSQVLEDVAARYIQREYNEKVIKALQWEISLLKKYLRISRKKGMCALDKLMCKSKKSLYRPVILSDGEYAEKWLNEKYDTKGFSQGEPLFETSFGLRVRSKSEIMIAEALNREKIPFKYEYPFKVRGRCLYPDFVCLNVRKREAYIWEHFGLLHDKEYLSKVIDKMVLYEERGYVPGKNMIITGEDGIHPLSAKKIEKQIQLFLK